jgi:leucyl aminopeptidase (aminopeptidase T)
MTGPARRTLLDQANEGAVRVLSDCLGLSRGDAVAIFWDESTAPCVAALTDAADQLGIELIDRFLSIEEQRLASLTASIGRADQVAIDRARAVLICVASGTETIGYRKALVHASVDVSRYVGMIPGATLEVLGHAVNIDYDEVQDRCDDLAVALLLGNEAVLTTVDASGQGRAYELRLGLGLLRRSPITSTGIIEPDTWGNLPGGETFIAPVEGTACGEFLLNGSFTGHVLADDQPLVLRFDGGHLVGVDGVGLGRDAFDLLIDWPRCARCVDPLSLAELGIGVNTNIDELRGNPLFDEKMARTAHIAVGDNSIYGGRLHSHMHEDFITRRPSLRIDGKPILADGEFVFDEADWREDMAWVERAGQTLGGETCDERLIGKRPLQAGTDRKGRLSVMREVGAKRKCIYTVGTPELSRTLARLWETLPPPPETISLRRLAERWQAVAGDTPPYVVRGLLAVLMRHELVGVDIPED